MREIRLKISDLFEFEGNADQGSRDIAFVQSVVERQFAFLPKPLDVKIEGECVAIKFPEESPAAQSEAARLAERAGKRADEGNYDKAIGILKRVLELQPSLHSARRDLAMIYVEKGEVDNAINHLIEVLRFNPKDPWSWVVLGNLYLKEKKDVTTGGKFIRKALDIAPDDAWALNSLATMNHQEGKDDEALNLFGKAIASNPKFPNAYVGKALVLDDQHKSLEALNTLDQLFSDAGIQDARSQPLFENARRLMGELHTKIAEKTHSEAFKIVQAYKAEMEKLSGYPIRSEEENFADKVGATIQMAWKYGRNYHLIKTRRGYASELLAHIETHELTHLKMESEARNRNKNLFFSTTGKTKELAMRSIENDMHRWKKQGYPEETITRMATSIISGLCGFLYNCPLDMMIERHIHESFSVLRSAQFLSVRVMANEAWETNANPELRKMIPAKIMQASLALNGAYALFLDDLFKGATTYSVRYQKSEAFPLSQRLFHHWRKRSTKLEPGDEYKRFLAVFGGIRTEASGACRR